MRYLFCLSFLACTTLLQAQIKGNKKVVTKTFEIADIRSVDVSLYADVKIDCGAPELLTITAEENLFEFIGKAVDNGKLVLDQTEWIQPSEAIQIRIGAPNLTRVEQSTHETTVVENIDREDFRAMAKVGRIILMGRTTELGASGEVGEVDARAIDAETVNVNLWSWGTIRLGSPEVINGIVEEGILTYQSKTSTFNVRTKRGGRIQGESEVTAVKNPTAEYIDIKIKNNSSNRINAFVRGPKPDGRSFSYGFPLRPGQVKKERWTVGTKVYTTSKLGLRKMLVEIEKEDENKIVKLYAE